MTTVHARTTSPGNTVRKEQRGPFFESSRRAFLERWPELAAGTEENHEDLSLVIKDGRIVDARFRGQELYGGDVESTIAAQLDEYWKKPYRFFIVDPAGAGMSSPIVANFAEKLVRIQQTDTAGLALSPVSGEYFLVSLGIGLGLHLERLYEQARPKWLILAEPFRPLLALSWGAMDWAGFLDRLDRDGATCLFVHDTTPDRIVRSIGSLCSATGPGYLDGSYVFIHYPCHLFPIVREKIYDDWVRRATAVGFFEDELQMLENASANLARRDIRLLARYNGLRPSCPVFVIGSGASVDEAWPVIRRFRENAIVISCGSSLRACLRNGVTPDIHVEIENTDDVPRALEYARDAGDLSGVTLFAPTTVRPAVPGFFRKIVLFQRDSLSTTHMFGKGLSPVMATGPTVANTALGIGFALGFRNFHLFGIDCGIREGGEHHARDTMYYVGDDYAAYIGTELKYPLVLPANFGGTVRSHPVLRFSRDMLAQILATPHSMTCYNCSDGAAIPGAIPLVPERVRLPDRRISLEDVLGRMDVFVDHGQDAFPRPPDFGALKADAGTFLDRIRERLATMEAQGEGPSRCYREILAIAREHEGQTSGSWSMFIGTLRTATRIAMFFVSRTRDPDVRQACTDAYYDMIRHDTREMQATACRRLDKAAGQFGPGSGAEDGTATAPHPGREETLPAPVA